MSVAMCVLTLCTPARALAQHVDDGASKARIRVGPLGLTPRISLRNFGVDTNVLHSDDTSRKDFMATFVPELDSWMRVGRLRVAGISTAEWTYFGRTTTERSVGRGSSGMAELQLSHFSPYGGASYLRTEQSPSLEIVSRVPQTTTSSSLGVSTTLFPLLRLDVEGVHTSYGVQEVTPETVQYATALNRRVTNVTVSGNYELTPLTTLVVRSGVQRDRFDLSPLRNSDSFMVTPGLEFKPFALISGRAFIGYRRFSALDPSVPDYSGMTAEVNTTYIAREMTRVMVAIRRDLQYSYEITQPYYIATTADFTVTQMLGPGWDVVGRAGRGRMAYRNVGGSDTAAGRKDGMANWGVGLGRHLTSGVRVGFDVDYQRRVSVIDGREFHGFRLGGSVTYGS